MPFKTFLVRIYRKSIVVFIGSFLMFSCATYKAQYKEDVRSSKFPNSEIAHSFYLIGDAGYSSSGSKSEGLMAFEKAVSKANENSTALFLGDNIYPNGLPKKEHEDRAIAEHRLTVQTEVVKDFAGRTIFIPGNHDWYSDGPKGLKRQENFIEDKLGKNSFLPKDGCPITLIDISDEIVLIVIDSEWYITKWDKHPTINDQCEFRTRFRFFEEF